MLKYMILLLSLAASKRRLSVSNPSGLLKPAANSRTHLQRILLPHTDWPAIIGRAYHEWGRDFSHALKGESVTIAEVLGYCRLKNLS